MDLEKLIMNITFEVLCEKKGLLPIGVSNRHVHLSRGDMDILFGVGSELTFKKALGQPGQFAAEEVVTLKGFKGSIERVRVLGPLREETQVEISKTDSFALGIKAPVRESGVLDKTPGIELIGSKGSTVIDRGVIIALRHIHMPTRIAQEMNIKDKSTVRVNFSGLKGGTMDNVLVRVSDMAGLEMHIDMDEANAFDAYNGQFVQIQDVRLL